MASRTETELKLQLAGETGARQQAEIRTDRAEGAERNLTAQLDRAHRRIDQLEALARSAGLCSLDRD